ncbi:MAG TPA: response regulator [Flavisolibacter sp.]|nr:response regulator [Flavisolibacter sp.]
MKTSPILIVDDDEDDRYMLQHAFKTLNQKVQLEVKSNGEDAIAYLEEVPTEHCPCLIVLDYNMPVLNGKEVLKHICSMEKMKDTPTIIFSTSNSSDLAEECINSGAFAFKTKPALLEELLKLAEEFLKLCKNN